MTRPVVRPGSVRHTDCAEGGSPRRCWSRRRSRLPPRLAGAAPGDLDTSFAGGIFTGAFPTTFPGSEDSQGVAVDSQGRVYLGATEETSSGSGTPTGIKVTRLSAQGVPDSGYGSGGVVTLPTTGDVRHAGHRGRRAGPAGDPRLHRRERRRIRRSSSTRLTTGGLPGHRVRRRRRRRRARPDGNERRSRPEGLGLTADGQALVAGTAFPPGFKRGFIARFDSAGALDTAYGTGGWTQVGDSGVEGVAIARHRRRRGVRRRLRRLPRSGSSRSSRPAARWTARSTATASRARPRRRARSTSSATYGLTADAQQRPIVTGQFTSNTFGARMTVMRWTATGAPDTTFGDATPVPGSRFIPAAAARGSDVAVLRGRQDPRARLRLASDDGRRNRRRAGAAARQRRARHRLRRRRNDPRGRDCRLGRQQRLAGSAADERRRLRRRACAR